MAQYRKENEKRVHENESIDGMFLTILNTYDEEIYGYCITKDRTYNTLYTYCFYRIETDSLQLLIDEVDTEYHRLVISTTEERLKMLDALRAYGYSWNFQKRQIE